MFCKQNESDIHQGTAHKWKSESEKYPMMRTNKEIPPKVLLKTTLGDIDIELWSKEAPLACRNFVQLSLEGYYNGTMFHRVVQDFIAQGGDPTGTGEGRWALIRTTQPSLAMEYQRRSDRLDLWLTFEQ